MSDSKYVLYVSWGCCDQSRMSTLLGLEQIQHRAILGLVLVGLILMYNKTSLSVNVCWCLIVLTPLVDVRPAITFLELVQPLFSSAYPSIYVCP